MLTKIIGSLLGAALISSGAFAADPLATSPGNSSAAGDATLSLEQLCAHTRLSAADQTECKRRVDAATTEMQRKDVRKTFEVKAGLTAGSSLTSGSVEGNGQSAGIAPRRSPESPDAARKPLLPN